MPDGELFSSSQELFGTCYETFWQMTPTNRRQTDKVDGPLMEANALLRMVIDENPNIILMKDWDGKFLLGNRALANLYGTTPSELVGKDDSAFNPNAKQVDFYLQNVRQVMSEGKTQVVLEESTDASTGETLYYQSIKIPLTTEQGKKQILVIANDVSELKRTQKKLEESERRLRYVLDATGEGLWDWNIATGVVSHNRRWCQIVGLDDAFLEHSLDVFMSLLHEDDKEQVSKKLHACLTGYGRYHSEHRMVLNDGRIVWVQDRGDVVERNADGEALRMVGSFVDISERKTAELQAEHASQLLREAVNSIAQGFTIYDADDKLFLCNDAYLDFYQSSRDLIVPGNSFEHIVRKGAERGQYSDAIGQVDAWVKRRVAQHQEANGEVIEQRLADGRWLLVVEYRTPSGYIVGNRIDITAQKAAQRQAADYSATLDAIFSMSSDGFVAFDENYLVKYVSPAFCRMTALAEQSVLGLHEQVFSKILDELCLSGTRFGGVQALRHATLSGSTNRGMQIELAYKADSKETNSSRVLSVALGLSQAQGVSQILYLRDITNETEVDRLKSEFMTIAAHELRSPMASIYGFAELLLTQTLSENETKELLGIIYRQSGLMNSILNELLDLARIEARRGRDFVFEKVLVQDLVREVVTGFKLADDATPPTLDLPSEPVFILVDQKKAQMAILNVLSNAYKYSSASSPVAISVHVHDKTISIRVVDSGIGMTPEQARRVGERFYRADKSGKFLGTGLGLSIVKEIMLHSNGSLKIESVLGQGSTISLEFPLEAALEDLT